MESCASSAYALAHAPHHGAPRPPSSSSSHPSTGLSCSAQGTSLSLSSGLPTVGLRVAGPPPLTCVASRSHTALRARASSSNSRSPPSSPSKLSRRELKDYAWVYGPASTSAGLSGISLHSQHSSNHPTSLYGCGQTSGLSGEGDNGPACEHGEPAAPAATSAFPENPAEDGISEESKGSLDSGASISLSLGDLIRESILEARTNCDEQMDRLGAGKDEVAEVVHDLRVVLRRLRNMLSLFHPFLEARKELEPEKVSRLLKALGAVRDSGAMTETLEKVEQKMQLQVVMTGASREPALASQVACEAAREGNAEGSTGAVWGALRLALKKQEEQQLSVACKELQSRHGRRLFRNLKDWAKDPTISAQHPKKGHGSRHKLRSGTAHCEAAVLASPLSGVAPSILAPYVSSLLLHPAWHLEEIWSEKQGMKRSALGAGGQACELLAAPAQSQEGAAVTDNGAPFEWVLAPPDMHLCECAHDLRKHLRELRYAMELLAPAYTAPGDEGSGDGTPALVMNKHYKEALARVKELQGVLGDLQDLQVLSGFVERYREGEERRLCKEAGRKSRGRRGRKGVGESEGEGEATAHSLADVENVLLLMQKEVWGKWLEEREKVSSTKGRYKLFKAMLKKPTREVGPSRNQDSGVDDSQAVPPASDPAHSTDLRLGQPQASAGGDSTSATCDESNDLGQPAPAHAHTETDECETDDVNCRLWSSRTPVTAEWGEFEVLPENLLPAPLAEIAREGDAGSGHGRRGMEDARVDDGGDGRPGRRGSLKSQAATSTRKGNRGK